MRDATTNAAGARTGSPKNAGAKSADKTANLRPRYEPPTLEDALFAAEGLTDEKDQQIAIAAELMRLPVETVAAKAEPIFKARAKLVTIETSRRTTVVVERRSSAPAFTFERKSAPTFVVERKAPRKLITLPR